MSNPLNSSISTSSLSEHLIHLQINSFDSYQDAPTQFDRARGNSLPDRHFETVPVIRVYGSLASGQNVLCHIHGIFPYIYIAYDGREHDSSKTMGTRAASLHMKIEKKLKEVYARKPNIESSKGSENSHHDKDLKYVADVSLVRAVNFYGYHRGYSAFYKISLLRQSATRKLSELLRDGKVSGSKCQVFEAHIPYLLQFSTDYNLFGCSWLRLHKCYFRTPLFNTDYGQDTLLLNEALNEFLAKFHTDDHCTSSLRRVGRGLLEIDIIPQFIQNREEITYRDLHSLLFESSQYDKEETLFIPSTKELWNQTCLLRNEFSLGNYKRPVEVVRTEKPQTWQSHEENIAFLRRARERMSLRNKTISKSHKFAVEELALPNLAITFLWPTTGATKQTDLNVTNMEGESSIEVPISPNSPRSDGSESPLTSDSPKNSNILSSQDEREQNIGYPDLHTSEKRIVSQELQASSDSGEPQAAISAFNDKILTQAMTQKRTYSHTASDTSERDKIRKIVRSGCTIANSDDSYRYTQFPLRYSSILSDLERLGHPKIDYRDPYFKEPEDLKKKGYTYSGRKFSLRSTHLSCRKPVDFGGEFQQLGQKFIHAANDSTWKYAPTPPNYWCVKSYATAKARKFRSQIVFQTLSNEFGYKFKSGNSLRSMSTGNHLKLSHLTIEVFCTTRGSLLPDPAIDPVTLIFWKVEPGSFSVDIGISQEGLMAFSNENDHLSSLSSNLIEAAKPTPVAIYSSEDEMLQGLVDLVLLLDPDILSGFEVHSSSWGYVIDRCNLAYDRDFCEEIARVEENQFNKKKDVWGYSHDSGIRIAGRHVLNIWRLMRSSLNLLKYTLENICFHTLHERLAHFPPSLLTRLWITNNDATSLITLLNYWKKRTEINLRLLESQQTINQTVEQARLIGVDFYSVISRGSQFKVESVLIRLCKSEHYLALSPSKSQVRKQKALECIPLVMEPESAFYKSPLVVLDFQSLYPSIMIGYNYCYSTILGRVQELKLNGTEVGASDINIPRGLIEEVADHLSISPNGVVYMGDTVRRSMLAKMLADILHTRLLVKTTMSNLKSKNETISNLLNSKQVALKLLANVTYGYTSASFSGRMPCSDVADSIVQTGRETLQKAISLIESNSEWGAKVVYGDTDSLFVYMPGKSKEEAFRFGKEMASKVTSCNPSPVTLKFEKLYHPCILVSKKRYVGYSYEKEDQLQPKFDAKGIETVRRDGHPAQQKIVEKSLRILFETQNLSAVRAYVQDQFLKIIKGQVSVQDFCFAREVKLGSYKSEKTAPPGAVVAQKQKALDHRAEPQYRERVSYVVTKGRPGQILRDRCIPPEVFLSNDMFELDSTYYITKTLIPPLQRFFNLIGVDVTRWFAEMPRVQDLNYHQDKNGKLPDFMRSTLCFSCKSEMKGSSDGLLCANCLMQTCSTAAAILEEDIDSKRKLKNVLTACRACCEPLTKNSQYDMSKIVTKCDSQDCPVYYSRIRYGSSTNSHRARERLKVLKQLDHW
ncbi:LADA_0C06458g1_1 [Lachancea dasiensis]|uniref:DNA polymerase n=1 Tax=Lachancea dasiensis TaxID=1072105 RepID=A0A1G4IZ93_9SACH|nr:LADA_0C06458g1_1 [Lachancea dasiensis]